MKDPSPRFIRQVITYDWSQIETEYVTGDESLSALAQRWGLDSHASIREHAMRDNWVEKRSAFRRELGEALRNKLFMVRFKVREQALNLTQDIMEKYTEMLKDGTAKVRGSDAIQAASLATRLVGDELATLDNAIQKLGGLDDEGLAHAEAAALARLVEDLVEEPGGTESGRESLLERREGQSQEGSPDLLDDDRSSLWMAAPSATVDAEARATRTDSRKRRSSESVDHDASASREVRDVLKEVAGLGLGKAS